MQDTRESAVRSWLRALTESIKQVLLVQPQCAYYREVRRRLAELEIVYCGYSYALGRGETVISSLPRPLCHFKISKSRTLLIEYSYRRKRWTS